MLYQAYGITEWTLKFGVVDWRDDEVIELIRDQRIRNGSWTINRARADIGEPPIEGGDDPILVDRQNMVLWSDLNALSKANLQVVQMQGQTMNAPVAPTTNPGSKVSGTTTRSPKDKATKKSSGPKKPGQVPIPMKAQSAPGGTESVSENLESEN